MAGTPDAKSRVAALAALNLAAVTFGSVALFGRIEASPLWIVAGRSTFAAALLLALTAAARMPLKVQPRQLAALTATGAILALHWVTFFASVQMAGVAVATLTFSAFPFFTILIEAGRRRRAPPPMELLAGLVIVAAVALLTGPGLPATPAARLGLGVGLGSAVCFAVFALLAQRLVRGMNTLTVSFYQNLAVTLLLLPFLPFTDGFDAAADWLAVATLGVIGTALSQQLYLFALHRLPAALCGSVVSLEPVYAILLAALLFGDPVPPVAMVSAAMIVLAAVLLLRRPHAEA